MKFQIEDYPETTWSDVNDDGVWCPSCGELIAAPWCVDEDWTEPESCKTCGLPDDVDKMAEYFA